MLSMSHNAVNQLYLIKNFKHTALVTLTRNNELGV